MSKLDQFKKNLEEYLALIEKSLASDGEDSEKLIIQIAPFVTKEYEKRFKNLAALNAIKNNNPTLAETLDGQNPYIKRKIKKLTEKRLTSLLEKRKKQLGL
tara:strand:+ start:5237 stop:5539 length:303 start_codon:yes stop_codon:yes gene_type:complete